MQDTTDQRREQGERALEEGGGGVEVFIIWERGEFDRENCFPRWGWHGNDSFKERTIPKIRLHEHVEPSCISYASLGICMFLLLRHNSLQSQNSCHGPHIFNGNISFLFFYWNLVVFRSPTIFISEHLNWVNSFKNKISPIIIFFIFKIWPQGLFF